MQEEVISFKACQAAGHCRQPLSRVCVQVGCHSARLLCYSCQKQEHPGHKTISLGQFIEDLKQKSASVGSNEVLRSLDELCDQTNKKFDAMSKELLGVLSTAKSQFQLYYRTMKQIVEESQQKRCEFVYDHKMPAAQLHTYIAQFVDRVYNHADQRDDAQIAIQLAGKVNVQVDDFSTILLNFTTSLIKRMKEILDDQEDQESSPIKVASKAVTPLNFQADQTSSVNFRKTSTNRVFEQVAMAKPQITQAKISSLNNLSDLVPEGCDSPRDNFIHSRQMKDMPSKSSVQVSPPLSTVSEQTLVDLGRPFRWSMILHHPQIQTLSPSLASKSNKPGNMIVAILGHQRLCAGFRHKWRITLPKARGFVFVGICQTHKVQQFNFTCGEHWIQEDNGLQIVGTDGFLFTTEKNGKNHTKSGLKILQNGKGQLNFVYDPQAELLTIENAVTREKINIKVSKPKEDNYRLCVFMQEPGDMAELSGHSEPISK